MDASTDPVRIPVAFANPRALLSEFMRSVGAGSVALRTRHQVEVGTRFVFELRAAGVARPVEVEAEVVRVTPALPSGCFLHVAYSAGRGCGELEGVARALAAEHRGERQRRHPRVPLRIVATEERANSPQYLARDLSRGGASFEVVTPALPPHVRVGQPVRFELSPHGESLTLEGQVVWTAEPPAALQPVYPSFGVRFGHLAVDRQQRLEGLLTLRRLPPFPWRGRLTFGEAVGAAWLLP